MYPRFAEHSCLCSLIRVDRHESTNTFRRPETAGLTLVEIDELYQRGVSPRKWRQVARAGGSDPVVPGSDVLKVKAEAIETARHVD